MIERYLARRLPDEDRAAFEAHYFACERCFGALELAGRVRAGFEHRAQAGFEHRARAPGGVPSGVRGASRGANRGRVRVLASVAAAALVVAGAFAAREIVRSGSSAELAALGEVERGTLPPYVASHLRAGETGDSATSLFERGMEAYVRGEHSRAAELLRRAVRLDTSKAVRHFYLGASSLAVGETEVAIPALEVAAREPGLAAQADFLLAKAHLQRGAADEATAALDRVIRAGGSLGDEARALRARVQRIRAR